MIIKIKSFFSKKQKIQKKNVDDVDFVLSLLDISGNEISILEYGKNNLILKTKETTIYLNKELCSLLGMVLTTYSKNEDVEDIFSLFKKEEQ